MSVLSRIKQVKPTALAYINDVRISKIDKMRKSIITEIMLLTLLPSSLLIAVSNPTFAASDFAIINVPDDYPTIQDAIDAATPGDTIRVASGTYHEHITSCKSRLALVGEAPENTIIDGYSTGTVIAFFSANDICIKGFTIQGTGEYGKGICLDIVNESIIINNILKNCDIGISLTHCNNNSIIGNVVTDNSEGIVVAVGSSCNFISENMITNNGVGIDLRAYSSNSTVSKNTITNNFHAGIYLSHSTNNLMTRNYITDSMYGFDLHYASNHNNITGNTILKNNYGICIHWASENNTVHHNNFINNTEQADSTYLSVNLWDNGVEGNHWSDYNGTDVNGDGVGDTPYVINKRNQDNYPLMTQWEVAPSGVSKCIEGIIILAVAVAAAVGTAIYLFKIRKPL